MSVRGPGKRKFRRREASVLPIAPLYVQGTRIYVNDVRLICIVNYFSVKEVYFSS